MTKKFKPNHADINIFYESVKGVKPLVHNKIQLNRVMNPLVKASPPPDQSEMFNLSDSCFLPPVRGDEFISYKHVGVPNKTLRKLQKGQYNVEDILDLHSMSIEKARVAVDQFLQQCMQNRVQVALIIHGKGHHSQTPALKNKLNHWLREIKMVLAFCSARPAHGRQGAVYVLLKRIT